jgi:DNA-binding NarL/FixJ family response regulator
MKRKVIIFEDNNDVREGYSYLIKSNPEYELAGAYINCDNIVSILKTANPDVLLMDIEMPGTNGIEGIKRIRQINQDVRIIMLTVFDDNKNIFEAIKAGASGYLLKKTSPSKIFDAIEDVLNGGAPMTPGVAAMVMNMLAKGQPPEKAAVAVNNPLTRREKEILSRLVDGYSYKLIASELFITPHTIKTHIRHIYEKLQVQTRTELITRTLKDKIV